MIVYSIFKNTMPKSLKKTSKEEKRLDKALLPFMAKSKLLKTIQEKLKNIICFLKLLDLK